MVFVSLSVGGWSSGELPDAQFLQSWIQKFNLTHAAAPFVVAASPRDAGKEFWERPHTPNTIVVDAKGVLFDKKEHPGAQGIVEMVRNALSP